MRACRLQAQAVQPPAGGEEGGLRAPWPRGATGLLGRACQAAAADELPPQIAERCDRSRTGYTCILVQW